MKMYRTLALIGILVMAVLLAFPLRDSVYEAVIIPLAYVFWVLGLVYHAVHQALWWVVVIVVVLVVLSRSLLPQFRVRKRVPLKTKPIVGQVESLSVWLKKTEKGIYFKWLVANRLGKIAHQILAKRDTGKNRSVLDPLTGTDWNPQAPLQTYLESGLHGSFADYPRGKKWFSTPAPTPLDLDMKEAIDYLESQVES